MKKPMTDESDYTIPLENIPAHIDGLHAEIDRLRKENERQEKTIGELGLYVAKLRKMVEAAQAHRDACGIDANERTARAVDKALRELDQEANDGS
jgi:predicted RNase H-like nuclease (RuvC/YqgF family)